MKDWAYAQTHPSEELAELSFFTMKKQHAGGSIEFVITVKEYLTPADPAMRFFAQADKQTNQKTMPFTPTGWGPNLLAALSECVIAVNRFAYEGE